MKQNNEETAFATHPIILEFGIELSNKCRGAVVLRCGISSVSESESSKKLSNQLE